MRLTVAFVNALTVDTQKRFPEVVTVEGKREIGAPRKSVKRSPRRNIGKKQAAHIIEVQTIGVQVEIRAGFGAIKWKCDQNQFAFARSNRAI